MLRAKMHAVCTCANGSNSQVTTELYFQGDSFGLKQIWREVMYGIFAVDNPFHMLLMTFAPESSLTMWRDENRFENAGESNRSTSIKRTDNVLDRVELISLSHLLHFFMMRITRT